VNKVPSFNLLRNSRNSDISTEIGFEVGKLSQKVIEVYRGSGATETWNVGAGFLWHNI